MLTQSGLFVLLAKATIILVVALGITRLMQRASAGARHLVWLATLGALLLIPAVTTWAPLRIAVLPSVAPAPVAATTRMVSDAVVPAPATVPVAVPVGMPQSIARTPLARWAMRGVELVAAIWAAVMLLILGS